MNIGMLSACVRALALVVGVTQSACAKPADVQGPTVDRIADVDESCVETPGGAGCVPDSDGDGTLDDLDRCPMKAGNGRFGCPTNKQSAKKLALSAPIDTIYFTLNSADLGPSPNTELDAVAKLAIGQTSMLFVSGFADEVETAAKALAKSRAERVRTYLVDRGVPVERIAIRAQVLGPTEESDLKRSRRVELAFEVVEGARSG